MGSQHGDHWPTQPCTHGLHQIPPQPVRNEHLFIYQFAANRREGSETELAPTFRLLLAPLCPPMVPFLRTCLGDFPRYVSTFNLFLAVPSFYPICHFCVNWRQHSRGGLILLLEFNALSFAFLEAAGECIQ